MTKRLLIDATHAEETRVVVLDGDRVEDFDVETSARKQIKGNIFLAKVVRVEPSLQAAFVEYGGNRHGFLAFSEIHPDYYQIPVADRQKLLALQAAAAREEDESDEDAPEPAANASEIAAAEGAVPPEPHAEGAGETAAEAAPTPEDAGEAHAAAESEADEDALATPAAPPETLGGSENEASEDGREPRLLPRFLRQYKIQEVIHRRQILLVQVVKEERGSKGAALTTYISLAGRFCVLMPNSPRGGGVSRKITSLADRRRLKEVIAELGIPEGMSMIVRTAGANRPKPEIKRDCEYLLRLWDEIRETTLASIAPALVYEDASLIKRAIRDVYSRDIDEVIVDGEAGWKSAHEFMRLLMPSHARKVIAWNDGGTPLFAHYQIEQQLEAVFSPTVQLRSGGYLVINQAEALVAIDVNSGRATRERDIEDTALRTNLEAADEVARQLRLRDLAGLIVIDFIDMEQRRHNLQVERRLKEALRQDRARIQVGSISHFGLLEMSRQRLRPSLAETSLVTCPHCGGLGHIRSTESAAIHVLRAIEEEGGKRRAGEIAVHAGAPVVLYIVNKKRALLSEIETRFGMQISFQIDPTLTGQQIRIERLRAQAQPVSQGAVEAAVAPRVATSPAPVPAPVPLAEPQPEIADEGTASAEKSADSEERKRRRRRRRRGGKRRDESAGGASEATEAALPAPSAGIAEEQALAFEPALVALPAPMDLEPAAHPITEAGVAISAEMSNDFAPTAGDESEATAKGPEVAAEGLADAAISAPESGEDVVEASASQPEPAEASKPRTRARRVPAAPRRRKTAPKADAAILPELALPGAPQPDFGEPFMTDQSLLARSPLTPTLALESAREAEPSPAPEPAPQAATEATEPAFPESDAQPGETRVETVIVDAIPPEAPRKRGWWRR